MVLIYHFDIIGCVSKDITIGPCKYIGFTMVSITLSFATAEIAYYKKERYVPSKHDHRQFCSMIVN